jgi:repressor LexA
MLFLDLAKKRQRAVTSHQITTLKRFILQGGVPYLRAANPRYPDLIPARELVIQGVMIALLRLTER